MPSPHAPGHPAAAPDLLCDVLVAGGGPCGAVLAGLLAQRGHATVLASEDRGRTGAPIETLLPGSLRALQRCGLDELVVSLTAADTRRHAARWDSEQWIEQPPGRPGLCLRRPEFEAALRQWAGQQGAELVRGRVVQDEAGVHLRAGGQHRAIAARVPVFATGRRAAESLSGLAFVESGAPTATFALVDEHLQGTDRDLAAVEATADGWAWWIGLDGGPATTVVSVDQRQLQRHGRARLLQSVLAACQGPCRQLAGADIAHAVQATPRFQHPAAAVFLVGDAAGTLDPLASQGTEKALVAAEHAALCIDTALADASTFLAARECHARWERDLWLAHQQTAGHFYGRVARFADQPFWRARATLPDSGTLPARLIVASDLQQRSVLHRHGAALVADQGFAVAGGFAMARVGHVRIAPILAAFESATSVETAIAAAGQHADLFALGPRLVLAAVTDLWRRGLLQPAS